MDASMNGKAIKEVWFEGAKFSNLKLFISFHGEYDIPWAIEYDKENKEVARYNLKQATMVVWEEYPQQQEEK